MYRDNRDNLSNQRRANLLTIAIATIALSVAGLALSMAIM